MSDLETTRLVVPTEDSAVSLKDLILPDAGEYFQAVDSNREHLGRFEPEMVADYIDIEAIRKSITKPKKPGELRMGIWKQHDFAGGIDLIPVEEDVAEIGYWLSERYTGRGYATLGVRALTAYAAERYYAFCARVKLGNVASMHVLERAGFKPAEMIRKGNTDFQMFDLYPHGKDDDVAGK